MKVFRVLYMLLGLIASAYGITFDNKTLQIVGLLFVFTVWIWEYFLHDNDSKRLNQILHNIKESDNALNIQRDNSGRVTNNPFDMGEYPAE